MQPCLSRYFSSQSSVSSSRHEHSDCSESTTFTATSHSSDTATVPGFVNSTDPSDGPSHSTVSREVKRHLVGLGPFQPCLTSHPVREHGSQKRSFQAKWFESTSYKGMARVLYNGECYVLFCL